MAKRARLLHRQRIQGCRPRDWGLEQCVIAALFRTEAQPVCGDELREVRQIVLDLQKDGVSGGGVRVGCAKTRNPSAMYRSCVRKLPPVMQRVRCYDSVVSVDGPRKNTQEST